MKILEHVDIKYDDGDGGGDGDMGSCTYYVITFGGSERHPSPPLCNIVIIWAYPPYVIL